MEEARQHSAVSFHPFLLILLVPWVLMLYVTLRGLTKNEFRRVAATGWHHYATGSRDYWVSTATNLAFLGVFTFLIWESLTDPSFNPPTIMNVGLELQTPRE